MKLDLTTREEEVLQELATKLDLSPNQVMRQALRLYQSVDSGAWKAVEVNPMPMMLCPHENKMVLQMKPDYTCSMPNGKVICWVIERDINV